MPRRVALITGPTSGIGEGFARRYAADLARAVTRTFGRGRGRT